MNRSHLESTGSVFTCSDGPVPYTLAIVEFDDQGLCFGAREQMKAAEAQLDAVKGKNAIIVVFVHGWRHDGRLDDENLTNFRAVLAQTAVAAAQNGGRPVLGVFGAWRGLSWHGLGIDLLTFFYRKEAAMRVALGSMRELLGRLRGYRLAEDSKPILIIIGHSFGGLIVYSAVAQSLIEAAATQPGKIVPSFANLVLLVNPAFEAARYLPIHQQIFERTEADSFVAEQRPVFVSVTARNDWATGWAFPLGMRFATRGESGRGRRERQALTHTMGHLDWLMTHRLTAPGAARASAQPKPSHAVDWEALTSEIQQSIRSDQDKYPVKQRSFVGGAQLDHVPPLHLFNPFWVVQAAREVVDGHDGIWGDVFVSFVRSLVAEHL